MYLITAKNGGVVGTVKTVTDAYKTMLALRTSFPSKHYQCLDTEDYGRGVLLDTELWQPKVMADPTTIFSVLRLDDGALYVNWSPDMYPIVDQDGKDTDRIVDLVEEILGRAD